MKAVWKDCTSYSRGEHPKTPRSWSLSIGKMCLTITKAHIYHPGWWVLTCEPFFNKKQIGEAEQPVELVRARALALLAVELETARAALEKCA